jgi:hypothetical protein
MNCNIYLIFISLLSIFSVNAQNVISIEEAGRRIARDADVGSSVREINDINNFFDPYIGDWRTTYDGKIYDISIFEERIFIEEINLFVDQLSFSYTIKDAATGSILAESSYLQLGEPEGIKFQPVSGFYELLMFTGCRESKKISMGFQPIDIGMSGNMYDYLIFVAINSEFHQNARPGCQSYSSLIPNYYNFVFIRI